MSLEGTGRARVDLVTGAFGYTGSRIAERLLARGRRVLTLTRRDPGMHPLARRVERLAYDFSDAALHRRLADVDTVYATYWMRFPRDGATWELLVRNVRQLSQAAADGGVRRFVFVSVSSAAHNAPTAYFRAKAVAEDDVRSAAAVSNGSMSAAIVRPTLIYGLGDILLNNMAWTLRRAPVFGIPGDGEYRLQPVHVDDLAELCVELGRSNESIGTDAAGPEVITFNQFVRMVREAVASRARLVHLPVPLVLATTKALGLAVRDVVLTRDELRELMGSLLVSARPATCRTKLTEWLAANGDAIGRRYSSELARNFRRLART